MCRLRRLFPCVSWRQDPDGSISRCKTGACESEAEPDKRMEVCGMGCIGCGDCADNCPSDAITMTDGHPVIDHKKCQNCGICTYVCSRGLIQERVVPEYIYLQQEAMKLDMEERG